MVDRGGHVATNLNSADLMNADLTNADLRGADLRAGVASRHRAMVRARMGA